MPPWISRLMGRYRKLSTPTTGTSTFHDWMPQNDFLRRLFRRCVDFVFSNRRLVIVVVLVILLLLYFFPNLVGIGSRSPANAEPSFWCLFNQLTAYSSAAANYDAFVRHHPNRLDEERPYVHFVGNGHLGLGISKKDDNQLRIFHERSLALGVGLNPLVSVSVDFDYVSESAAYVTDVVKGKVTYFHVYRKESECIVIEQDFYAHRSRPELLSQEITVRNPTNTAITLTLKRSQPTWTDVVSHKLGIGTHEENVHLVSKQLYVPGSSEKIYVVSALLPDISQTLTVPSSSSNTFRILTLSTYSQAMVANYSSRKASQEDTLTKLYSSAVSVNPSTLLKEHETAWLQLWSTGFGISHSKAPDVLNGDMINATIYYVLSNTPSPLHDLESPAARKAELLQLFYRRDRCYSAHNTLLYPSRLWSEMHSVQDVVDLANRWKLTLEKRGCADLVKTGADGVLQAIILSFGAFKFTQHHLEFDAKPQELHRDYSFRQLVYGENAFINIWVVVGSDNKPTLYVTVNQTGRGQEAKKFYACDAGCLDSPVELGASRSFLPVKLTDPPTPILYVTDDRKHIEELKHSIHVIEVAEAPAHEHHVIAMHKHGHRLGGLPTLFWVALAFLLITFHLFLFNLIYNEYCRDDKQYGSGRSSNWESIMSGGQSSSHHTPRDAKVMAAILKDAGVEEYEPRVINQMLEFAYRYVSDVLDDARIYSEYSNKKSIDADDVRLAVQMKVENTLTNPPSRELLSELAQEKNAVPLPPLKQQYGLRLPPDRYCTLQPNFHLKPGATVGARTGSGSSATTPSAIGVSQQPAFRGLTQQPRRKQVASPPVTQKPKPAAAAPGGSGEQTPISSAIAAAKPATSAPMAKPLFRLVSGSTTTSSPRPTLSTTGAVSSSSPSPSQGEVPGAASAGVKRKLEPLDEDYDQI